MRIEEIISEPQVRCYSIGDSHGEGIAKTSSGQIINYAHGGRASTNTSNYSGDYDGHPTGIDRVPPGSRVIISQGCNDAANSSRANLDSNGRTPLVKPERIAANVARLVDAATSKGCQVIFVLFPNGDAKVKPYYGGAYQLAVREAIRSAVGVPVIDLEGSALTDGVHCTRSAYQSAGARALEMFKNKATVKESEITPDRTFLSRCQAIVEKIAQTTPIHEYREIIRSVTVDVEAPDEDKAFSIPSHRLLVVDEEEFGPAPTSVLIWLLAHELGHIVMSHAVQRTADANQQQERQADDFANDITRRLGISKVPVFSWLGRRKNELGKTELERKQQLERDPANADFFKNQSHPTTDQRIKQGGEQGVELSKANTDQIDWLMSHTA